jgi:rubrerythrin
VKRPINPIFPIGEVRTVDELMDIATAMEREAGRRYEELALELERAGNAETAALFRDLAIDEQRHEDEIARWATREGGRAPQLVEFRWRMPETFEREDLDRRGHFLTPHQALAIALKNEEKAFAFYAYLSAIAEDEAVRQRAEALARGELEHVARLRARRHTLGKSTSQARRRVRVGSLEELHRLALGLERGSDELESAMAKVLEAAGEVASAAILRRIAEEEHAGGEESAARAGAREADASEAVQAAKAIGLLELRALTAEGALQLCRRNADEVVQTYLDVAAHTKEESVMREAQRLAERAVGRLATLNACGLATSRQPQ